MGVQFLFPQYNSSLAQATLHEPRFVGPGGWPMMTEICKLFIGALYPHTEIPHIVQWMSCMTDVEAEEIYIKTMLPGEVVKSAFAIYRRASE